MGTKISDIVYGDECAYWDPPSETPKYIYAFMWDVLKGNSPGAIQPVNLHLFKLTQLPGAPCNWRYYNESFGWDVWFTLYSNRYTIYFAETKPGPPVYFIDELVNVPPPEYQVFVNDFQEIWPAYGYEGFATIFWLDSIRTLAEDFGLDWSGKTLFEIFPHPTMKMVIKFCEERTDTNIKILLE